MKNSGHSRRERGESAGSKISVHGATVHTGMLSIARLKINVGPYTIENPTPGLGPCFEAVREFQTNGV